MKTKSIRPICFAASLVLVPGILQPAVRAQPPQAPPTNVAPPPENANGRQGAWANMTPEQRREAQKEAMHRYGVMVLGAAGITDVATQDALLDFYIDQQQEQVKFREQFQKFARGLVALPNARDNATPLTDEQIEQSLTDLQTAVAAEKTRRQDALAALDLKIHYTKNPRLQAILIAGGLDGEAASLAGNGATGIGAFLTSGLGNAAETALRANRGDGARNTTATATRPAAPGDNAQPAGPARQ